jgi:hypothetical protein
MATDRYHRALPERPERHRCHLPDMQFHDEPRIQVGAGSPVHPPRRDTEIQRSELLRGVDGTQTYGIEVQQLTPVDVAQSGSARY